MSPAETPEDGFETQFARDIIGIHTEFVFQRFTNRWFLLITQYGKVPNLYTVRFDVQRNQNLIPQLHGPVDHPDFHVSVPITLICSFGADNDEVRGAIQFLVNKTALNKCPKGEFLIGLGLKDLSSTNLREIIQVLHDILQ